VVRDKRGLMRNLEDDIRAARLKALPKYLFEALAETRRRREAHGQEVIDLSIGDPDIGAPPAALDALKLYADDRRLHRYTPRFAVDAFSRAVSAWMQRRFGVELDPDEEILPLIGTKEGIANLPLAVLDAGQVALVPDPAYPVYATGVGFAGGVVRLMPLVEDSGFLPEADMIRAVGPRMVYVNYPNNPTSATADAGFYTGLVGAAREVGALVVSDAAYSETVFDGYVSPSVLEVPGAMDVAVEFHSFSKTFSMAGWRLGFAGGNRRIVQALRAVKSNTDSGVFGPVLLAGAAVLENGWEWHRRILSEYETRRRLILEALRACGIEHHRSPATLYIWAKVPGGGNSMEFARSLLEKTGILVAPGIGFGAAGEGYFRISVTCPTEGVRTAADRMREVSKAWKN
jgi:LL-diaminopimelate aminotransferase